MKYDKNGNTIENPMKGEVVHTLQVAHVTFYIAKSAEREDWYNIYTETREEGIHLLEECPSHDQANHQLGVEQRRLEDILEHKRKGMPTPKQLHFLFREKVPIPLTLTWGEASDLIDERLSQKEYEKEVRQQALQKVIERVEDLNSL